MAEFRLSCSVFTVNAPFKMIKNGKKMKEVVEAIPMDRIVLETDSPYLAPEPNRGKRNSSLYLTSVIEKLAELRGVTPEEIEKITEQNGRKLFNI